MGKKSEFHAVDFFRCVRDERAEALAGKSPQEIIAFFTAARKGVPALTCIGEKRREDVRPGADRNCT